jgi:hypothetical protein
MESKESRLDEGETAQRSFNPDEFRPHPRGCAHYLVGIRPRRDASTLGPLSRTGNVPFRAGADSVGLSHSLGRFFSLEVQVQREHKVVNIGPYRLLRHPGYAGVLFAFIGLGLAVQSWVSVLILLLATTMALAYRAQIEEDFLITELGDEYIQYMTKTKRLVPYVW